ncbi:PHP domain-like protein [Laetiporus sulphureus 93-53]|uniref:PHP domain-like protein n=1 Tax=Laetiporus sulphureus 93-53 TaxID=1314785 RepID=A0A165EC51_9APHY|nr:PHP domain-like protein [Laetiporus sulphureus 93-53]KZT06706.1 PHP domain-like protein [Laetiporus sulphureus 93-53]
MFIDLNVPIPASFSMHLGGQARSKKNKGKQPAAVQETVSVTFTPAQISVIERRIDLLVHLGYTVFALNQTVRSKVERKTHVNIIDPLVAQLRERTGVVILKRITIVLDEDSEQGYGLTTANASLFAPYDIISLLPTTAKSFFLACDKGTEPSPLTAHIIALPLTLPRLPFYLKHTMVRKAIKQGAVFEIQYAGALGAEVDLGGIGGEGGTGAKRNWWAAAREVIRVTNGKGVVVSGGVLNDADLRAPRDVANLITMLGLSQDVAHDAISRVPQSLILRAQTRRTYRAIFSEPKIVIPSATTASTATASGPTAAESKQTVLEEQDDAGSAPDASSKVTEPPDATPPAPLNQAESVPQDNPQKNDKKRPLCEGTDEVAQSPKPGPAVAGDEQDGAGRKRKKKKTNDNKT